MDLTSVGKLLIVLAGMMAAMGLLVIVAAKVPYLGRLPGDIIYSRGNFSLFAPLVTMLLVSAFLTLVLNLVMRLVR